MKPASQRAGGRDSLGGGGPNMSKAAAGPTDIPGADAQIDYLVPGPGPNRRFWAKGAEINTGTYAPAKVRVGDARAFPEPLSLETNGFLLVRHESAVTDFRDKAQVDHVYPAEMVRLMSALTGANVVLPMTATLRSAAAAPGDLAQPPATDAHVDFTTASAERFARALYERSGAGPGYSRFAILGQWRAFSPPPQDWPLALCDARTIADDEGVANTLVIVDELPPPEALDAPVQGEAELPAAWVFERKAHHRWWYFPNLEPEELIVFKFYDLDHARPWRTPHTAFRDRSFPGAGARESLEFRVVAYWT